MELFNEVFDFQMERVFVLFCFFNFGCSVKTSTRYSMLMERGSSKFLSVRGSTAKCL